MGTNVDEAYALARAMRESGDPLLAHVIEAGLDDAVGQPIPEGGVVLSPEEVKVAWNALMFERIALTDGKALDLNLALCRRLESALPEPNIFPQEVPD